MPDGGVETGGTHSSTLDASGGPGREHLALAKLDKHRALTYENFGVPMNA